MELTEATDLLLALAGGEAAQLESKEMQVEHVFLALLKAEDLLQPGERPPAEIERRLAGARPELAVLAEHWRRHAVSCKWMRRRLRKLLESSDYPRGEFAGRPSDACHSLLERAERIAREHGERRTSALSVLAACLQADSRVLSTLFEEFEIERAKLVPEAEKVAEGAGEARRPEAAGESPFARYGRDLTALARAGRLAEVIGRKEEIKTIARILSQRTRNNPLLLGDPGVGKTAVVEGLAVRAAAPDAPEAIREEHFVEVSLASLVAGAVYRGQFEERLQELIELAHKDPHVVLFIDEMHTLIGAGAGSGSLDAANMLKPALSRGDVRCIGATTVEEYRKFVEPDPALARRFQIVWINEPSRDETLEILRGLKAKLEQHHHLEIPDAALVKTVELCVRYVTDAFFPDKAIMVLDEACARRRLATFTAPADGAPTGSVQVEDVAQVVARRTQVPFEVVMASEEERLLHAEAILGERVIGQPRAVETLARAVRMARAGLRPPGRPIVALFAGPSGTGKTELAKALAAFLCHDEARLIRLDMTEFREPHSVAKIIGSPPGYVGFGEEPLLIREIRKHPYSVVLLDEIEKAHPDVLTTFMQVFDEGRLTDARGRTINVAEAIFILTSNLGAGRAEGRIGIGPAEQATSTAEREQAEAAAREEEVRRAVAAALRPELLNRIQEVVVFQPLSRESLCRIVESYLAAVNQRLVSRNVVVALDGSALDLLLAQGASAEFGARHLHRAFERAISHPLSQAILDGSVESGDTVVCRREGERIALDVRKSTGTRTLMFEVEPETSPKAGG